MSCRDELPAVASNAIEQLLEQCQASIRRLLVLSVVFLFSMLAGWLLALAVERAS